MEKDNNVENRVIYNLVEHINLSKEHFTFLGLSEQLLKINMLRNQTQNISEEGNTELIEISGGTFGKLVSILQQHDDKYKDNLDAKSDYSDYSCYVTQNGLSGFCINKSTNEFCNFYSVQKGLGKKILDYALENYDCLGIANALPETYENYYQSKFDVITHHWEENWDYPGDKSKAVWFGYILPKGTLSEKDRVDMQREGKDQKDNALSETEVKKRVSEVSDGRTDDKYELSNAENDVLNMRLSVLDDRRENILDSALDKCRRTIQINTTWRENTYSKNIVAKQMNDMWKNQFSYNLRKS
ncbi:MAG: hypothetical protein IJV97_02435 [Alphaproteobacteria bacterium]|nr:hypothetical protein [Alphaproteobacteria bacterium]